MFTPKGSWQNIFAFFILFMLFMLPSCGYKLDGYGSSNSMQETVLGDGTATLKIEKVEHVTMYPWVEYYLRGIVRDEIQLRRLGKFADKGDADYLIFVTMPGFKIRSSISNREDNTLIADTNISLELIIRRAKDKSLVWRSGVINYADKFENINETNIIKDGLKEALYQALDRLQQQF